MRNWFWAGIAGGILMFVWSSVAHVVTPLGQIGFSQIPNEAPVLAAMHNSMGDKAGLYHFPWVDPKDPNMMAKYVAATKVNPSGLMIYHPPGAGIAMMPKTLVIEFVKETVCALIAAFLLAQTTIAGYAARVGFVTLAGVAAAITTNVSYWNWYGFPTDYSLAYAFMNIVDYLAAGLAIALVLRKPASLTVD
jgi:hypothetical protein